MERVPDDHDVQAELQLTVPELCGVHVRLAWLLTEKHVHTVNPVGEPVKRKAIFDRGSRLRGLPLGGKGDEVGLEGEDGVKHFVKDPTYNTLVALDQSGGDTLEFVST